MYIDNSSSIDAAKAYASLGLSTFPVHTIENDKGNVCSCGNAQCSNVAKHPLTEHGALDASREALTLQRYFTGPYASANVAIATGQPSNVIVLDVDDMDALRSLEASNSPLPKTWTVETPSGGRHPSARGPGGRSRR